MDGKTFYAFNVNVYSWTGPSVIIVRKEREENLAFCFCSLLHVFERGFYRKCPITKGRNGRLKPVKLLSLIDIP